MSYVMVPLEDHFNNSGISFIGSCHTTVDLEGLDLYCRAEGRWKRSSTLSLYEYTEWPDQQIGKGI